MRVIAGSAKSLRLVVPKSPRLRPTSDAIRESLFSTLAPLIPDGTFVDLYAGTGSVGIEALSRGAAHAVFIERDRRCVQAIRENLANTRLGERATVIAGDVRRRFGDAVRAHEPFDVVFIDPPYADHDPVVEVVAAATASVGDCGVVVLQHSRRARLEGAPEPWQVRRFGDTVLSFYRRSG